MVAQADYNWRIYIIAGEYGSAIERLYAARVLAKQPVRVSLCALPPRSFRRLLELNLSEEARNIAHEGHLPIWSAGMRYEAAKTLANERPAYGSREDSTRLSSFFAKAREMLRKKPIASGPRLLDLYQALLLFHEGRHFEARRLCLTLPFF